MRTTAEGTWHDLSEPWRIAFDEAWTSWCEGNLGIGAVLVDPEDGEVVGRGRNRVGLVVDEPRVLSGNFMAHAEMNAFAALDRFKADGLHLYTTLEPCLMCAATGVFLHVAHVNFAAGDEYFAAIDRLWEHDRYTARHRPTRSGPLADPLAAFARVLPLTVQAAQNPTGPVMTLARTATPAVADLARELAADRSLEAVRDAGRSTGQALAALWPRLPGPS